VPVDRRLLLNIDWLLVGACLILSAIGVATILSATHAGRGLGLEVKQIYWILIGMAALLVSVTLDYRRLTDRALFLYVFIRASRAPGGGSSWGPSSSSLRSSPSWWWRCSWPRSSRNPRGRPWVCARSWGRG
jgi:hypothetical protein